MKRIGKQTVSESEMYLTISMKLQWCPPHVAQQFIKRCVQDGLLIKKDDGLISGFSVDSVSIPLGFKPSSDFFEKYTPKQSALIINDAPNLFQHIVSKTVFSAKDITSSVQKIVDEKQVTEHVALLLFAKKHDIDISSFIGSVEKEIFTKNKE
jgi:hypothetical protein